VRLGIFGGTFDPIHLGHLIMADDAMAQFSLDRIMWVLTPNPPHKQGFAISPWSQRLELLSLGLMGNPYDEISHVELDRQAPHFAVDTMRILRNQYQGSVLIYLMGGDSLRDLPTWHSPKAFIDSCDELGIFPRKDVLADGEQLIRHFPGLSNKLFYLNSPMIEISATDIRQRIIEGKPFRYFLPEAVYQKILKENYYLN